MHLSPAWTVALLTTAGALTKAADLVEDERMLPGWAGPPLGASFGLAMGIASWSEGGFLEVTLSIVIAVLLAGKVDARSHYCGLAAYLVALSLSPVRPEWILIPLTVLAYLDEPASDAADRGAVTGTAGRILKARPFLKLGILALLLAGLLTPYAALGGWGFDVGYEAAGLLIPVAAGRGSQVRQREP